MASQHYYDSKVSYCKSQADLQFTMFVVYLGQEGFGPCNHKHYQSSKVNQCFFPIIFGFLTHLTSFFLIKKNKMVENI